jgi:anti-sigma regulatory factor (Ser/Thr protein kinase)
LPGTPQSLTLTADPASLGPVTAFLRKGAGEAHLPELQIRQLELVVEELLANIWRYAYPEGASGTVMVTYSVPRPGEMDLEVGDEGVEFDPLTAAPPDLTLDLSRRPVGGLGIHLLKSFARSLQYRRQQGWNRLSFGISANP